MSIFGPTELPANSSWKWEVPVFPNLRDATFADMNLDGKTLKITVGWDGDYGVIAGKDVETGVVYILKAIKRPT